MAENLLQGLQSAANSTSQAEALQYFEQLKNSEDGWKLCGDALVRNLYSDETVKFFCFQVLEHYIKTRHATASPLNQCTARNILLTWLKNQCCSKTDDQNFLKNKAAQVFSLIFVCDYPEGWPTFFSDLLQCLQFGAKAVDMYLRILKAIDEEVVDRDVTRNQQEADRNMKIKDAIRETCITNLVDSWYQILNTYENSLSSVMCLCLDVIGAYIEWIDIGLIANDRFISALLRYMSVEVLRESACDCIHEIIMKGMEPVAKRELIESLVSVLEKSGVLQLQEDEDADFLAKVSKLMNAVGTQLLNSYSKLTKSGDTESAAKCLYAAEEKMQYLFRFLSHDDDDVSQNVSGFGYTYLTVLKQIANPSEQQKENLRGILHVIINKMKYDESYNFDHEGEDEVMFMEYRKEMKILFDNIAQLDPNLVLVSVHNILNSTFGRQLDAAKFMDVEIAVRVLYMVGEAMSTQQLYSDASKFSALQQMMSLLVTSNVSYYNHSSVAQMFFETVVRYDRFFSIQSQHIPAVLIAFLDERGLRNRNCTVRSRCSYLFSRFIKSHKANMLNYAHDVLKRLQGLLVISADNGYQQLLSADDRLFLYESAGILIVASGAVPEKQLMYMKDLLSPIIEKFDSVVSKLMSETNDASSLVFAQQLYHLVAYASRASKAFPNQQALKESGCAPCFTEALPIFLKALHIPIHRDTIHSGVRQYLHRMIVCLGEGVLPFIPVAVSHLLEDCTARDIQEFIPLINQIISRFKTQIGPFLRDVFMAIVNTIFTVLGKPADEKDAQAVKEKETLRRSYFLFVGAVVTNDVTVVLTSQTPHDLHQVLLTLIQGGVEFPDPVAQKISFNILRKLVELWGGSNGLNGFREFIYENIVPATFVAPMKSNFDMNDAQTILALQEIALTQKMILQKQGVEFIEFLQNKYLPTLQIAPGLIQEYTRALLHADIKTFKNYIKAFFTNLRS